MKRIVFVIGLFWCFGYLHADGPVDNVAEKVRPVPPVGAKVPEKDRQELEELLSRFDKKLHQLGESLKGKPEAELLPDVQIFYNAVHYALKYQEFYNYKNIAAEIKSAREQIKMGMERAEQLSQGKHPWTSASGLVVRGYRSRIDDSVQPYGLVVPKRYPDSQGHRFRLDIWLHGRGENLTELNFLQSHERSAGQFTPPDTFVLHPYGRYCNAFKFAGEIDILEAIAHVQKNYPIDDRRLVMRGFSMGGAGCWQMAVHYPSRWCAAAPGAGFSETAKFLNVFQNEKVQPTPIEKKLWHMYDCTDYALNLFNLPTIAYSGEIDRQRQAAEEMAIAMKKHNLELVHIIGPKTAHSYHKDSIPIINQRIDALAKMGKNLVPERVQFTTYTLLYNRSFWVQIDGLQHHWQESTVDATLSVTADKQANISINTNHITGLTLCFPKTDLPFDPEKVNLVFPQNKQKLKVHLHENKNRSDGEGYQDLVVHLKRQQKSAQEYIWVEDSTSRFADLHKIHGLQGPIDDALMDRFIMVIPTGTAMNPKTAEWVQKESKHAIDHWRKQFRGEARVKKDTEITNEDIADSHLILWGDPKSNKIMGKIMDRLPIRWTEEAIACGDYRVSTGKDGSPAVLLLVYPNPLNPQKYVVFNSGFTFREYDYLNNARQVPKLPDFAIVDIGQPANSRYPGKIRIADFFDESWQLPKMKK